MADECSFFHRASLYPEAADHVGVVQMENQKRADAGDATRARERDVRLGVYRGTQRETVLNAHRCRA